VIHDGVCHIPVAIVTLSSALPHHNQLMQLAYCNPGSVRTATLGHSTILGSCHIILSYLRRHQIVERHLVRKTRLSRPLMRLHQSNEYLALKGFRRRYTRMWNQIATCNIYQTGRYNSIYAMTISVKIAYTLHMSSGHNGFNAYAFLCCNGIMLFVYVTPFAAPFKRADRY
jgi:hypothetical protein